MRGIAIEKNGNEITIYYKRDIRKRITIRFVGHYFYFIIHLPKYNTELILRFPEMLEIKKKKNEKNPIFSFTDLKLPKWTFRLAEIALKKAIERRNEIIYSSYS